MFPELTRDDVFTYETQRLWLRWPRAADAPALQAIAAHAEVARMTATWPHPLPPDEAERRVYRARQSNTNGQNLVLAVTLKNAPDRLIGMVGGGFDQGSDELSFGYMLAPAHWSRGLMSETVRAYADIVFTLTNTITLLASVMQRNPASRRVLEKVGFEHLGAKESHFPARGETLSCDRLRLTRAQWSLRTAMLSSNWRKAVATAPSHVANPAVV